MKLYFGVLGVIFLCSALVMTWRRARIAARGLDAEGEVLGPSVNTVDGFAYEATRVAFHSATGAIIQFTYYAGTPRALPAGTRLPVRYLPGEPGSALVSSLAGYALGPAVCLGLASVCLYVTWR